MKNNRFLLFLLVALFTLLPYSVNAEEFKDGDTKYFIEKANLKCEISNRIIDLDDTSKFEYAGMDKNGNFVYTTIIKNSSNLSGARIYVLNNDGCIEYDFNNETGLNYLLSAVDNYFEKQYVEVENNEVFVKSDSTSVVSFEKAGNPDEIDLNKNNYCQYNEITKTTVCGLSGSKIDLTREFFETIHLKPIPSTNIDLNNKTLKYYRLNDKTSIYEEVSAKTVKKAIAESPINAIQYYIESNDTKEYVMIIENEKVLELLNQKFAVIYDYDSINKIAYFFYQTSDADYGFIDSNGKEYGKELEPYHYSNNLVWALLHGESKSEYVITDKSGNILYTLKDVYFEVDDDSVEPIYELNNIYKPFHEIKYENYMYDLFINGISKNNIYRIYEYKLLSEDNRKIDGSSNYVAKFSGLVDRVKSIKVDNDELDVDAYVTGENTIVTLDTSYLKTLNKGEHILTVEYVDGVILTTKFTFGDEDALINYKLTFDANGGTFKNGKSLINFDSWNFIMLDVLEVPTKDGYKFKGWYTEKEGGIPLVAEPVMTNINTLYAQWEEKSPIISAENPKTNDNIISNVIIGTISLTGLIGAILFLKKGSKERA